MLIRRLTSQTNQAKTFLQAILGLELQQSNQRADLVRDKFGLHKMIVAVTSASKVIINLFIIWTALFLKQILIKLLMSYRYLELKQKEVK